MPGGDNPGMSTTAERHAVIALAGEAPGQEWVILTRGLTREYEMGGETVHALRGVNLAVKRNEYVAIMGPSGSGKSTLMNLIGCLDTPTAGEYWLNGTLVSAMSDNRARAYPESRDRLRVPDVRSAATRRRPCTTSSCRWSMAGSVGGTSPARDGGAGAGAARRPNAAPPNELSGGQRQRVAIARALVNRPGDPARRRAHRQPRFDDIRRDHAHLRELARAARRSSW